ncbi:MAG: adenylate kinase family protein [Candidatus Njordarchaeales archaeon]
MKIIIICGSPGTGKTTLANLLAKKGFKIIHLSEFVIKEHLYSDYDYERDSYIIDPKRLVKRILLIAHKESRPIVVEGIGADLLPKKYVSLCIVLTCEPGELERRLKEKKYPPEKIWENLEAERLNIILGEALDKYGKKTLVIDTTNRSPEEVLEIILNKIFRNHEDDEDG